jgi:hypothetical protein
MIRFCFVTLSIGALVVYAANAAPGEKQSSPAPTDELYDLRGPNPEKGQIFTITEKSTTKDAKRTVKGPDGAPTVEVFDESSSKKKEVEVLAVDGFDITKMRTKIIQDQREETRPGKGRRQRLGTTTAGQLEGQYIYSVRTKMGWKNSLEDAEPTDKQKKSLKEYEPFKEEDVFYPKDRMKVGHEWKIDQALFERVFGPQMDDLTGSGTGKFLRVLKADGEDVAEVELQFELAGTSKEEFLILDIKMKGKVTVHRSLKYGFDRSSKSELTMSMKGKGAAGEQIIEVQYDGVSKGEDRVELSTKKP